MQFGLRQLKGRLRPRLVAARNRGFDLLDEGAHPTHPGAVDSGPLLGLTDPLFRRFVIGHALHNQIRGPAFICARRGGQSRTRGPSAATPDTGANKSSPAPINSRYRAVPCRGRTRPWAARDNRSGGAPMSPVFDRAHAVEDTRPEAHGGILIEKVCFPGATTTERRRAWPSRTKSHSAYRCHTVRPSRSARRRCAMWPNAPRRWGFAICGSRKTRSTTCSALIRWRY